MMIDGRLVVQVGLEAPAARPGRARASRTRCSRRRRWCRPRPACSCWCCRAGPPPRRRDRSRGRPRTGRWCATISSSGASSVHVDAERQVHQRHHRSGPPPRLTCHLRLRSSSSRASSAASADGLGLGPAAHGRAPVAELCSRPFRRRRAASVEVHDCGSKTTWAFSVARLTLASWTPSTRLSAFSTRRTHEAQVMPSIGSVTSAAVWSAMVTCARARKARQARGSSRCRGLP